MNQCICHVGDFRAECPYSTALQIALMTRGKMGIHEEDSLEEGQNERE